jgi:AraC family transcriptional regulator
MLRSQTSARLETDQARIHVYTYRYERPSKHTRSPQRDVLALFANQAPGAAGFFRTADTTSRLMPIGGLILVPAGASISATGPGGDRRLAVCTMTQGILPDEFDPNDQRCLAMCSDIQDPQVRGGMRRLAAEAASPGLASDVLVDGISNALRVDLARYLAIVARRQRLTGGTLAPWQLRRVEEYVHASEGQRLRIADLAAAAEVSPGHLVRTFKKSTGRTVHEFVEDVRLARAHTLLAETTVPLKQVASRLGFGTPSSFSLAFRRATGTTPGRYREEHALVS